MPCNAVCQEVGNVQHQRWISGNVHYIRLHNRNKAEPTLALKPREDVTRNPKQGYQWPKNMKMKKFTYGRWRSCCMPCASRTCIPEANSFTSTASSLTFFFSRVSCKNIIPSQTSEKSSSFTKCYIQVYLGSTQLRIEVSFFVFLAF